MTALTERIEAINAALRREIRAAAPLDDTLQAAMEYSLMAGGKRLRPVLLMAAADALGVDGERFLPVACAVEMIHTYSLIHDDLPAMDNDDYRRGKPTNHKVYGAGMATLAGDGLLTLAFEVMLRQPNSTPLRLLQVVREISCAAGPAGMVGGQAIDLRSEGKRIDLATLRAMHMAKTGAMFRAAVRVGAILAGASAADLSALTDYAEGFGLAFQITDDILDVVGDEATLGKPVGSDERNAKSTYVTLTSLEESRRLAREAVDQAVGALERFGQRGQTLRELVLHLLERRS